MQPVGADMWSHARIPRTLNCMYDQMTRSPNERTVRLLQFSPCKGSSGADAHKCPSPRNPCMCSFCADARRCPFHRTPCIGIERGCAGTSQAPAGLHLRLGDAPPPSSRKGSTQGARSAGMRVPEAGPEACRAASILPSRARTVDSFSTKGVDRCCSDGSRYMIDCGQEQGLPADYAAAGDE